MERDIYIIIIFFAIFFNFVYKTTKIMFEISKTHYYYIKGDVNGSYFNYIYDYQLSNRLDKNNIFGYYRGGDTYLKFNKSNNNTYIALYDIPIKSNNLTFKIFKSTVKNQN